MLAVWVAAAGCRQETGNGGAADAGGASSDRPSVAFVTNQIASFWNIAKVGAEDAGKDLDVNVVVQMPAIATAVIMSKDEYNKADPIDDAAGTFVPEIVASVQGLHDALDDDLTGLGLVPCATGDCVGQAAPFVVPDVVSIDPSQAAGFPNGRRLTDPVIDVTLALVLLDLGEHPVTTLVGVNPTENDKSFRNRFPYLARPHRGAKKDDWFSRPR